jgi:hypothetical protein
MPREWSNQLEIEDVAPLQSSGENQPTCKANHQLNATQSNVVRLALVPIVFSDKDLADVFYSGVEVL